jgi:radical SAM-linked protein
MLRLRIYYAKTEPLRYTGNLDIHRIWERTLRRARLPIAYSQGFHPQPRLNQACPLPLGITSLAEMIDVWLDVDEMPADIAATIAAAAPPGIEIQSVELAELNAPALQTQTVSTVYTATLKIDIPAEDLTARISETLAATELLRKRRGKSYDLRQLIEALHLEEGRRLVMQLAAREGATGRPEEVLDQLGLQPHDARLERTALTFLTPQTTE